MARNAEFPLPHNASQATGYLRLSSFHWFPTNCFSAINSFHTGFGSWLMLTTRNPASILSCDLLQFGNRLYARTAARTPEIEQNIFPDEFRQAMQIPHPHHADPRPPAGLRLRHARRRIEISDNPPAHRRLPLFFRHPVVKRKHFGLVSCTYSELQKTGAFGSLFQPGPQSRAVCIRRTVFLRLARTAPYQRAKSAVYSSMSW